MLIFRPTIVWLLEMVSESIATAILFMLPLLLREKFDPKVIVVAVPVFMMFNLSGYTLTTACAGVIWRSDKRWVYPSLSAILYAIHSEILFVGVGNKIIPEFPERVLTQTVGPGIAFGCAYAGNTLLRRWRDHLPANDPDKHPF